MNHYQIWHAIELFASEQGKKQKIFKIRTATLAINRDHIKNIDRDTFFTPRFF